VVLLFLTRGEMTESLGLDSAEEVARARTEHADHVAQRLGCELMMLDYPDTQLQYTPAVAREVARVIADVAPSAVITWGQGWQRGVRHPDHQATGEIVRAAITLARMKRAVAPIAPHRGDAPVFTLRDRHSTLPVAAIDVTPHLDLILELGAYYRERVGWPEQQWLRSRLERVGYDWGVPAAEEFDAWESRPGLRDLLFGEQLPP